MCCDICSGYGKIIDVVVIDVWLGIVKDDHDIVSYGKRPHAKDKDALMEGYCEFPWGINWLGNIKYIDGNYAGTKIGHVNSNMWPKSN